MTCGKMVAAFAVVLAVLLSPISGRANDGQALAGLWQGIDGVDGSLRTISITETGDEGVFEVLANDTFWTLCDGSRGLQVSRGAVGDDGVLRTEGSLACASGETVAVELTYAPQGREGSRLHEATLGTPFENVLLRVDQGLPPSRAR